MTNLPAKELPIRALTQFALLCGLCCALFTTIASLVLLLLGGPADLPQSGLLLRIALFGALSIVFALLMWKSRLAASQSAVGDGSTGAPKRGERFVLLGAVVLSLTLTLPNLGDWPRTEPDETHHLIVAKNLADIGRYASGNPEAGYRDFDPFDSIGPVGIVPAALTMRAFGNEVVPVRVLMALALAAVVLLLYLLFRPPFGSTVAWGVWLVPMVFSSVYLGRTFYGEVPAMMFLLLGLLCWRRSIGGTGVPWAFLAGCCFGLMILVKAILLLSACAFAVVILHDFMNDRRIRISSIVATIIGTFLPLAAWSVVQSLSAHSPAAAAEGTVALYRHYLLFGIEPLCPNLLRSLGSYPLAYVGFAAGMFAALPVLFGLRGDPAVRVLMVYAMFNFFWWLCFTPGQLPRYLWYSHVAMAPLLGTLTATCFARIRRAPSLTHRNLYRVAAAALLAPPLWWVSLQAREVYTNSEMADVHALAEFVDTFPEDVQIVTTHYPLEGCLSFLVDRHALRSDEALGAWDECDVLIAHGVDAPRLPGASARAFGVYWVLYRQPEAPQ